MGNKDKTIEGKNMSSQTNIEEARQTYGDFVTEHHIELGSGVEAVLATLRKGGNPLIVGGCVRDSFIGRENKDIDIEVHGGATMDGLVAVLRADGFRVDEVGKQFGVLKVSKKNVIDDIDVSIPRKESKIGAGHRGFKVELGSDMTVEEACARRDFTFNSIMFDPARNVLVDPYDGRVALEAGVLKHVSDAFMEDPLRVLRGFQFAGRFNLTADKETVEVCRSLRPAFEELAEERIVDEWDKFFSKSVNPSAGVKALQDFGWDDTHAGLREALAQADVVRALNELPKLDGKKFDKTAFGSAIIARHMSPKDAGAFIRGTVRTTKRQAFALALAGFDPMTAQTAYDVKVVARDMFGKGFTFEQFKQFSRMLNDADGLRACVTAWYSGVFMEPEKPFVQGRDLLALEGVKPGKWMGKLLAEVEEKQFRGHFSSKDEAMVFATSQVPRG